MAREMQRRGPGDYLVVAPSYKLMAVKCIPEFVRLFQRTCRWGEFTGSGGLRSRFLFNENGQRSLFGCVYRDTPTQVFVCHAQDPDALESATAKAAWLDEAGQAKFRYGSWEAVQRRLAVHQGRILITTTPYTLGWLKSQVYDPWKRSGGDHPDIDVVGFKSTENPAFPVAEFERMRETLPPWRFRMMLEGEFSRPAGSIFEDFDREKHVLEPFAVPSTWHRYVGLDFGGVHTAAVFLAAEQDRAGVPTGRYIVYREYPMRAQWVVATAKGHVASIKSGETKFRRAFGGSGSEDQWRSEFGAAGMHVEEPPISDVEVGISRVVAGFRTGRLAIFRTCTGLIDDVESYARELDDRGEPTEAIEDKASHHYCDALRYACAHLFGGQSPFFIR